MCDKKCTKCGGNRTAEKHLLCANCNRDYKRSKREFIGPPVPRKRNFKVVKSKNCLECGVHKTIENTYVFKSGRRKGDFFPRCKECQLRLERASRAEGIQIRKQQIKERSSNCSNCGVLKTTENTRIIKSGKYKGHFRTLCISCNKLANNQYAMSDRGKKKRFDYNSSIEGRASLLWLAARTRAIRKFGEITISKEFVRSMFISQNNRCSLTGIEFSFDPPAEGMNNNPYSPSLDRIDPSKNYTEDNTRLILTCVNIAINEWGLEFLKSWISNLS